MERHDGARQRRLAAAVSPRVSSAFPSSNRASPTYALRDSLSESDVAMSAAARAYSIAFTGLPPASAASAPLTRIAAHLIGALAVVVP